MKAVKVTPFQLYFWISNALFRLYYRALDRRTSFCSENLVSIVRKINRPPYGGGNQFCLAFHYFANKLGYKVVFNVITHRVNVFIIDGSYVSDKQVRRLEVHRKRFGSYIIHRIDGPSVRYKGDEAQDKRALMINRLLADLSVVQSKYTLNEFERLGVTFTNTTVILNGWNSRYFYPSVRSGSPPKRRRVRLVAASWSDNILKGGKYLKYIDETIDTERYTLTFIGRSPERKLVNTRLISPLGQNALATELRGHDIYLALSEHDPCSNSLCDALGCGLPIVYVKSGGHEELVGKRGVAFKTLFDIWPAIEEVVQRYDTFLDTPSGATPMDVVVERYFKAILR